MRCIVLMGRLTPCRVWFFSRCARFDTLVHRPAPRRRTMIETVQGPRNRCAARPVLIFLIQRRFHVGCHLRGCGG